MKRLYKNHPLMALLIAAVLMLQWSTAHIHLADQHSHDGDYHSHQLETHSHHADVIDFSHQESNVNVVELDHECGSINAKKPHDQCDQAFNAIPTFLTIIESLGNNYTYLLNTKLSSLAQATAQARAPPLNS